MSTRDPKRLSDGFLELSAGVDQGKAPNLIAKNASAFAVNATMRGGWPYPRPGYIKRVVTFGDGDEEPANAFKNSLFQCAGAYQPDDGTGELISMHGGRVFRVKLADFSATELTISGDANPDNIEQAWCCQAENFFLIQDGLSKVFIYNGGSSRRSTEKELPVGKQMTYYMGRVWVANDRDYVAGDIVFGPSGTALLGYRDSVLKMTENQFLQGGGAFAVPSTAGNIVALKPIANINTALGQGELVVFTENNVFATVVPVNREEWNNTTQPIQRMLQLDNGAFAQDGVVSVNEDLFYRTRVGIMPLAYAVRNSGQWGNVPISNEITRVLDADPSDFLKFGSGVSFDNRMLMTASPGICRGRGVYHRALVPLDFDLITGIGQKLPPAWEGIWTGLRILKIVTARHLGVDRCFIYALSSTDEIELWELSTDEKYDTIGPDKTRIQWSLDTRSMDFGSKFDAKRLFSGDMFFDEVRGEVAFFLEYRPDSHPCWSDWDAWEECAPMEVCMSDLTGCTTLPNIQPQYRVLRQFKQPPDTFDPILKKLRRVGYEFQFRLNITGSCRLKQFRVNAYDEPQPPYGGQL